LSEYTPNITIFDPWANAEHVKDEYDVEVTSQRSSLTPHSYDAAILAVAHKEFLDMDVRGLVREGGVIYDVKGILPRDVIDGRL
jgi:UDP-N-acetyl-D-galactosamine dehydrogenase